MCSEAENLQTMQLSWPYEVHGHLSNSSYYCLCRHSCFCHEEDTVHDSVRSDGQAEVHLSLVGLPGNWIAGRYHGSAVAWAVVVEAEEMRKVATFGQVLPLSGLKLRLAS